MTLKVRSNPERSENGPGCSMRVRPKRQTRPSQSPAEAPSTWAAAISTVTPPPFFQGERRFLADREQADVAAQTLILYAPSGAAGFSLGHEHLTLAEDEAVRLDGQGPVTIRHAHGVLALVQIEAGA